MQQDSLTQRDFPCSESLTVEFKSDPKSGLSDRIVVDTVVGMTNAEGGSLYIGIDDNGTVSGLRTLRWRDPLLASAYIASHTVPPVAVTAELIKTKDQLEVLVIEVPKAKGIVASIDGKLLKRRLKIDGTPETSPFFPQEFITRLSDIGRCDYSAIILPNSSYDDIDPAERERLRRYIRENHGESPLQDLEDEDLETALGLVRTSANTRLPTVAGLLLLGKQQSIRRLLPGAGTVFQHLSGTDILVNEEIDFPLLKSLDSLLDRFRSRNSEEEFEDGLTRIAIPTFSERAFREALVNAFCHRDYTILNRISLRFSDDGMEITSPGGFVSGVSLSNLLTVEPHPRNALLADIFKRLGLAERTGRGIDRIFEGSLLYGRPSPDYSESTGDCVRVFFPRCTANVAFFKFILDYQKRSGKRISFQSLMVLSALLFSKRLTFEQIVETTHLPAYRLRRHVETLVEEGLLESRGSGSSRDFILSSLFYRIQHKEIEHFRQTKSDAVSDTNLVLQLAQEKGKINRSDVVQALNITGQSAYRLLRKLVDEGKLLKEGDKRSTLYRIF